MKIQDLHRSLELYPYDMLSACDSSTSPLEEGIIEGENPVFDLRNPCIHRVRYMFSESSCLGLQL